MAEQEQKWTINREDEQQGMLWEPPPALLHIGGQANELLVEIHPDGSLVYGPTYTPDAAAQVFWQALADGNPLKGENDALRQQLAQVTAERDTLVADVRHRQAGQKSAEEQLAKAREEVEFLHIINDDRVAERDALREENAAMRALLEKAAKEPPDFCWACPGKNYFGKIDHAYDCLIVQIRALLEQRQP